jgi:hypothetical protein
MKIYDIKVYDNFEVFFNLIICGTHRQMLNIAKKNNPKDKYENTISGLFCPTSYLIHNNFPGKFRSNIYGTMYLNIADIEKNPEIIVHECSHAAFDFFHYVIRYYGNFNENDNHGEFYYLGEGNIQESFCYFSELAYKKVWQALNQYKKEIKNG